MKQFLLLIFTICNGYVYAQTAGSVGVGTTTPNASAALDVTATNKGLLMPRLTTAQRKAISNPAAGLLVFDTDKGTLMFYDGAAWRAMAFTDENSVEPQSRNASSNAPYAGFGSSVAISGDYAVVGAPKYNGGNLSGMGLAFIFNKTSGGWKQVARLAAPDSAEADYFGGSVAISGDYIVVASANKKVGANTGQGKVYVYKRSGSNWTIETQLTRTGGAGSENFGFSVAVSAFTTGGPAIAVGAPYANSRKGNVEFFRRNTNNTWSSIQSLSPTDLITADAYGSTVVIDTDYVAVGATSQTNATYNFATAGAVYIYVYGGGVWNQQQKLQGTVTQGQFGAGLALSSNILVIAAPWATAYSNTSAGVNVYTRTGATWTYTQQIFLYNFEIVPAAGQLQTTNNTSVSIRNTTFGLSLALAGNTLLIGGSGGKDFPNGGSSYYSDRIGEVYIYRNLTGNGFTKQGKLTSDFPTNGDLFGQSLSISGNKYVIANSKATINGIVNAGNVYFGSQ